MNTSSVLGPICLFVSEEIVNTTLIFNEYELPNGVQHMLKVWHGNY